MKDKRYKHDKPTTITTELNGTMWSIIAGEPKYKIFPAPTSYIDYDNHVVHMYGQRYYDRDAYRFMAHEAIVSILSKTAKGFTLVNEDNAKYAAVMADVVTDKMMENANAMGF